MPERGDAYNRMRSAILRPRTALRTSASLKLPLPSPRRAPREIPVDVRVIISSSLLCDEPLAVPTELALTGSGPLLLDRNAQDAELSLQRMKLRGRRVLALLKQPFEAGEPAHVRVRQLVQSRLKLAGVHE